MQPSKLNSVDQLPHDQLKNQSSPMKATSGMKPNGMDNLAQVFDSIPVPIEFGLWKLY